MDPTTITETTNLRYAHCTAMGRACLGTSIQMTGARADPSVDSLISVDYCVDLVVYHILVVHVPIMRRSGVGPTAR